MLRKAEMEGRREWVDGIYVLVEKVSFDLLKKTENTETERMSATT